MPAPRVVCPLVERALLRKTIGILVLLGTPQPTPQMTREDYKGGSLPVGGPCDTGDREGGRGATVSLEGPPTVGYQVGTVHLSPFYAVRHTTSVG